MSDDLIVKVLSNRFGALKAEARKAAAAIVRDTAAQIELDWKARMTEPKHGRIYYRKGGKTHQASAEGEAPAVDYGAYSNSIQQTQITDLEVHVGTHMTGSEGPYPALLEFVYNRPAAIPAAEAAAKNFVKDMQDLLNE